LEKAITLLGLRAHALIRTGETEYTTLGLSQDTKELALVKAMVAHPALIQRPIVFRGSRAVVGRPPERVEQLL